MAGVTALRLNRLVTVLLFVSILTNMFVLFWGVRRSNEAKNTVEDSPPKRKTAMSSRIAQQPFHAQYDDDTGAELGQTDGEIGNGNANADKDNAQNDENFTNADRVEDGVTDTDLEEPPLKYADGPAMASMKEPIEPPSTVGVSSNPLKPGEIRYFPLQNCTRVTPENPYGHYAVANKRVYILWWDRAGRNWIGDTAHPLEVNYPGPERCPVTECVWTDDRSKLAQADGVLFHIPTFDGFPKQKYPGQKYIAFTMENELHFPRLADPEFMKNFDFRAGYWLSANSSKIPIGNIVVPYMEWPWPEMMEPKPPNKTAEEPISWFASNCYNTKNNRLEYIKELMKYIKVANYGPCLRNKEVNGRLSYADKMRIMGTHKFYLAFENANVLDYVTEKVWQAYKAGTVPIYMGTPNFEEHAVDPHSYIDANKFKSPKELADFLNILVNNDALYSQYLRWKYVGPSQQFKDLMKCQKYIMRCKICMAVAGLDMDYTKW